MPFGEPLVIAAELVEFLLLRIVLGLGPTRLGSERLAHAGFALAAPGGKVRGVNSFAPQ